MNNKNNGSVCYACKKGKVQRLDIAIEWYECDHCKTDSDRLSNGYLYPMWRRGTLCSMYTPASGLNVKLYNGEESISFLTIRKNMKEARIIHIDDEKNQMILEDVDTGKIRFVVDEEVIADSYSNLFPSNKVEFAGWWNRRIQFVNESTR